MNIDHLVDEDTLNVIEREHYNGDCNKYTSVHSFVRKNRTLSADP